MYICLMWGRAWYWLLAMMMEHGRPQWTSQSLLQPTQGPAWYRVRTKMTMPDTLRNVALRQQHLMLGPDCSKMKETTADARARLHRKEQNYALFKCIKKIYTNSKTGQTSYSLLNDLAIPTASSAGTSRECTTSLTTGTAILITLFPCTAQVENQIENAAQVSMS